MQRLRVWGAACLLFWITSWNAASVAVAAQPADGVPESASIVVRWKAPKACIDKLGDFVDAVQPGFGVFVKTVGLQSTGQVIGNDELDGVDTTQDWWLIVFAESGGEQPSVVFMMTAKDVDALKDALGDDYESHAVDNLVIYSEDETALGKVRDQLSSKNASLLTKIDAASKKLFDSSDLSVLVNIRQLTEEFEDELNQAEPQIDAAIDAAPNFFPEAQRAQMTPVLEFYRELAKACVHGVKDCSSLVHGITFSKSVIRSESRLQVVEKSSIAGFLAKQPPSALALVNRLPANQSAYFAAKADVGAFIEWSMKLTRGMMKSMSADDSAKLDAAMKEFKSLKYDEVAGYLEIASKSPALHSGGVTMVTPTKRMREISHSMLKVMGKIEMPGMTQTTTVEPAVDKIAGVEIDRITIKQEADEGGDPLGIQKKIQKAMFGENGMQQLVMYQPNRVVQVLGGGKDELQSLITALDATSAGGSVAATARQRLPEKANLIVLVDVAHAILNGVKLAASQGAAPVDISAIEDLKLESSFIGFSLTCEPTALRSQLEIPVTQAQSIAKIVVPLASQAQ